MTRSLHRGVLTIAHRPELCAVADHRGIAQQMVGLVLCRVHVAHRDLVLGAWWVLQAEKAHEAEVSLQRKPDTALSPVRLIREA